MAQLPAQAAGLPTRDPGNLPDVYQRVSATPDTFGAGSAQQAAQGARNLGAGLQSVGNDLFRTGQFFDDVAADDALNQYQARVQSMLTGDPAAQIEGPDGPGADTGYLGLKGRAALDARPNVVKSIESLERDISGKLTPTQQKRFNDSAVKYRNATVARIGSHAEAEQRAWSQQVNAATAALAISQIAASPNDPKEVSIGASDLINARMKQAQLMGARPGDEVWRAAELGAKREALTTQVEAMSVTEPAKALEILEKNRAIAGPKYDELAGKFRVRAAEQRGRAVADEVMAIANAQPPKAPVVAAEQGAIAAAAPPPEQVHAAIVLQESGGRMEVPVSVNGAIGPGQIMPETFKRFALPGERIDNPADNLAVSARIVSDYSRRYGGDPARVAVAYFSGEGNVAPPGSPTPWKEDRQDGNGKSVSSYVADVTKRLGGMGQAIPIEARIAQNRADAVRAVLNDPRLANDPAGRQAALTTIKQTYDAQTLAAEQDARARKEANDAAADGYIRQINAGQISPATLQEINTNPALTWETRRSLYDAALKKSGSDVTASSQAYGPGFWEAYRQVTAPAGDPKRIMDVGELLRRAGPGGDLTLDGVAKLNDTIKEMAKPESAATAEMKKGALAYAKSQLSFEFEMGSFKLADPKGMDDFNTKFIPAFYQALEDGLKAGKTPYQLLSKESNDFIVDKLVSAYRRPEAQLMRDRIAAGGNISAPAQGGYDSPDKLKAAVREGKITRDEGARIAIEKGWARIAAPAVSAPGP